MEQTDRRFQDKINTLAVFTVWTWSGPAGTSRATAEPGRNILAGPIWGEIFWILLVNGEFWCTFYFWATAGSSNVAGLGEHFSPLLLPCRRPWGPGS